MNLAELKELFELIAERNITEFELEEEGVKLRIKKDGGNVRITESATAAAVAAAIESKPDAAAQGEDESLDGLSIVRAPMVGTFYRQPEPGAEPFAGKGQQVKKGQTLCIIEAMKLMNELECEVKGTIVEICVENAQPVEYGQVLFRVDPA